MAFFIGNHKSFRRLRGADVSFLRWLFWGDLQLESVNPFQFHWTDHNGEKHVCEIQQGFKFNGGDVPRLFWWYVTPWNKKILAGYAVHDKMRADNNTPQWMADQAFYQALIELGMKKKKAAVMFAAVSNWN